MRSGDEDELPRWEAHVAALSLVVARGSSMLRVVDPIGASGIAMESWKEVLPCGACLSSVDCREGLQSRPRG